MGKLQVKTGDRWQWVFCRDKSSDRVAVTGFKTQALPAAALPYFQRHFANETFRVAVGLLSPEV